MIDFVLTEGTMGRDLWSVVFGQCGDGGGVLPSSSLRLCLFVCFFASHDVLCMYVMYVCMHVRVVQPPQLVDMAPSSHNVGASNGGADAENDGQRLAHEQLPLIHAEHATSDQRCRCWNGDANGPRTW